MVAPLRSLVGETPRRAARLVVRYFIRRFRLPALTTLPFDGALPASAVCTSASSP